MPRRRGVVLGVRVSDVDELRRVELHARIARSLLEIRKLRSLAIVVSEQVLSFTMQIADRLIVIDKGRFVHEDPRGRVDEKTISKYLSV